MGLEHSKKIKHYLYADALGRDDLEHQLLTGCLELDSEKVTQALELGVSVKTTILYLGREVYPLHMLFLESQTAKRKTRLNLLETFVNDFDADVNVVGAQGKTLIHQLCAWKSFQTRALEGPDLLAALLRHGAHPNLQDDEGNTPLHYCCQAEDRVFLNQLLNDERVDVNVQNNEGTTCLHLASHAGNFSLVKKLLRLGCDVNKQTHLGDTPLHAAFSGTTGDLPGGNESTVSLLLNHGARVDIPNNSGQTAGTLALDSDLPTLHPSLFNTFISKANSANFTNSQGNTLLHLCYTSGMDNSGNTMLNNYLRSIQMGVHGNMRNLAGLTALEVCINMLYLNKYSWIPHRFPDMFVDHLRAGTDIRRMPANQKVKFLELCCQFRHSDLVTTIKIACHCGFSSLSAFEEEYHQWEYMENEELMTLLKNYSDKFSLQQMCMNVIRLSVWPNPMVAANNLPLSPRLVDFIMCKGF